MSALFVRGVCLQEVVADRASGSYVWTTDGRRHLDFAAGIGEGGEGGGCLAGAAERAACTAAAAPARACWLAGARPVRAACATTAAAAAAGPVWPGLQAC